MRNFGTAANQVLWRGQVPLLGDANYVNQSIVAVDEWLANVEKDPRDLSLARKILDDKPKTLTDRCTDGNGQDVPAQECDAAVQAYSDPRLEAGMPMANDTIKCELKPLDRASYAPATFTDAEWKTMQQTFPNGVCDYSKPGVDRKATVPWQSYQDHDGNVVYGGRALGAVPAAGPVLSLGLRSARSCVSRRSFRIRVRAPRGQKLRSARVYLNGRRVKVRSGRATINLRGLPRGTARVKIVAVTRKGKRYVAARAYRTCTAKR
jgi:hypothetical protein